MDQFLKIFLVTLLVELATCSIAGLSYRDPIVLDSSNRRFPRGEDPCNPLYWYPRHIPADCNVSPPAPVPYPQPLPSPPPIPAPMPMPMPVPMPGPIPIMPAYPPPLPLGPPLYPAPLIYPGPSMYPPNPMMPVQAGFVPGLQGLVAPGGGINILPFSDAYADLLESHKQKIIRIRLQKLLDRYDNYPKRHIRRRNYGHKFGYSSEK